MSRGPWPLTLTGAQEHEVNHLILAYDWQPNEKGTVNHAIVELLSPPFARVLCRNKPVTISSGEKAEQLRGNCFGRMVAEAHRRVT